MKGNTMEAMEAARNMTRDDARDLRHHLELCTISPASCLRMFDIWLRTKGPKIFEEAAALRAAADAFAAEAHASEAAEEELPPLEGTPLVSCLMVSHNQLSLVKRSIRSFVAQTYPNKELVIVRDPATPPGDVEDYIRRLALPNVRLVRPEEPCTLSRLRNVSMETARGDVLCQWDDDDLCHPDRLRIQLAAMKTTGTPASFLKDAFDYYVARRELYWANWEHIWLRCLPGTIMFRRSKRLRYADSERFSQKTEDTLFYLHIQSAVTVGGAPYLYVYSFHDANTWPEEHRRQALAKCLTSMGDRVDELRRRLEALGLRTSRVADGADGADTHLAVDEDPI